MTNTDSHEYETKVVNIDVDDIVEKLRSAGAKETPEVLMRRYVFDFNPAGHEFLRLRDNGHSVTLTYKHRPTYNVGDTKEIETEVSDFEQTAQILNKLPIERILYQENRRWKFELGDIEFVIDTWPKLNPHLEVEAPSHNQVNKGLKLLGLEGQDIGNISVKELYDEIGIDLAKVEQLKFD